MKVDQGLLEPCAEQPRALRRLALVQDAEQRRCLARTSLPGTLHKVKSPKSTRIEAHELCQVMCSNGIRASVRRVSEEGEVKD